jgi:hypothetical protein
VNFLQIFLDRAGQQLAPRKRRWLAIFILFRLMLLALTLVVQATALSGKWTQYVYYRDLAALSDQGYYPLLGHWIEYPPLFSWLSVALYRLAHLIPNQTSANLVFYGLLGLAFVAAEVGILYLVYRLGRMFYDENGAVAAALVFGLTSTPMYLYAGWFDPIASLFLLWGLERFLAGRQVQSALAIAMGTLTKLFPLFFVAVSLRLLPGLSRKVKYAAWVGLVIVGIMLPFALLNPEMLMASIRWLSSLSSYQTVWAMIDGYYGYGLAPKVQDFVDPTAANWISHPSRIPSELVTLVFALLGLYIYTRPLPANRAVAALTLTGLTLQLMVIYAKGYSPQYLLWFLPLIPLILPGARGLVYSVILAFLNVVEYPVYFHYIGDKPLVYAVIILTRTAIWVFLAVEYWRVYRRGRALQTTPRP